MFKPGRASVPTNATGVAPDATVTPSGIELSFDGGANRNRQTTSAVAVTNLDAAAYLEVSFTEGNSWFSIAMSHTIILPIMIHRMRVRGEAGGTCDYSVMGVIS